MILLIPLLGCPEPEYIDPPGRTDRAETNDSPVDSERYHPEDFGEPSVHGPEAKQQVQVCVDCHGSTLEGEGAALSCDSCHPAGWRTDCVYCHGGGDNQTGAPPVHLSGVDEGEGSTFAPHSAHVQDTEWHAAFDCVLCHPTPTDVLSSGHIFVGDDTPGSVEVDFSGSYASGSEWNGDGLCSNVYCHGNGADLRGEKGHVGELDQCGVSCHSTADFEAMEPLGGEHGEHTRRNVGCAECHQSVIDAGNQIIGLSLHVNGSVDVELSEDLGWDGSTCTGSCHNEQHDAATWR